MCGVEQVVVLLGHEGARNSEDCRFLLIDPCVTQDVRRGRGWVSAPVCGYFAGIQVSDQRVVEVDRNEDVGGHWLRGPNARQDFENGKGPAVRCVDDRSTGTVPAPAVQARLGLPPSE